MARMARIGLLTVRVNDTERRMLVALAEQWQRTQSDTVRLLIRNAARELDAQAKTPTDRNTAELTGAMTNAIAG